MDDEEYFIDIFSLFVHTDLFEHKNMYRIWLNENIGRENWQIYGYGSTHPYSIRFEHRSDALAFKLKFNV